MGFFAMLAILLIGLKLTGIIVITWGTIAALCVGVPAVIVILAVLGVSWSASSKQDRLNKKIRKEMADIAKANKKE